MSVGAGSIKRATKANVETKPVAETAVVEAATAEPVAQAKKPAASKTTGTKTTTAKTTSAKKTTSKAATTKTAAPKAAVTANVIASLSPQAEKLLEQEATGSQACHLTEELPVHLL
ncbi:MAG: hypothetical protein E7293_07510 [Lachnospiraceae bacterium]|nr:hypothetical protein [Lachnospiraceae bacterium]